MNLKIMFKTTFSVLASWRALYLAKKVSVLFVLCHLISLTKVHFYNQTLALTLT